MYVLSWYAYKLVVHVHKSLDPSEPSSQLWFSLIFSADEEATARSEAKALCNIKTAHEAGNGHKVYKWINTSSTAQGGGGSFKNRKPIGEIGCCESPMAERSHWWTERWLISFTLSPSFSDYLPTYLSIFYVSIYQSIDLSIYRSIDLSIYRSIDLSIYRSIDLSIYRSIDLSIYLSIYLSISLFHLSSCLPVYLSNRYNTTGQETTRSSL